MCGESIPRATHPNTLPFMGCPCQTFSDKIFKELKSNLAFICSPGQDWPTLWMTDDDPILTPHPSSFTYQNSSSHTDMCWHLPTPGTVAQQWRCEDVWVLSSKSFRGTMHTRKRFKLCTVTFAASKSLSRVYMWRFRLPEKGCRREVWLSLSSYCIQGTLHAIFPSPLWGRYC